MTTERDHSTEEHSNEPSQDVTNASDHSTDVANAGEEDAFAILDDMDFEVPEEKPVQANDNAYLAQQMAAMKAEMDAKLEREAQARQRAEEAFRKAQSEKDKALSRTSNEYDFLDDYQDTQSTGNNAEVLDAVKKIERRLDEKERESLEQQRANIAYQNLTNAANNSALLKDNKFLQTMFQFAVDAYADPTNQNSVNQAVQDFETLIDDTVFKVIVNAKNFKQNGRMGKSVNALEKILNKNVKAPPSPTTPSGVPATPQTEALYDRNKVIPKKDIRQWKEEYSQKMLEKVKDSMRAGGR